MNISNISHLKMYTQNPISWGWRSHEISHSNPNIWLGISWVITPEFDEINIIITIYYGYRFYEILHLNQNILWSQILWYITPELQYLMVAYPTPRIQLSVLRSSVRPHFWDASYIVILIGHTSWAAEGRKGRSQACAKGHKQDVGAWRAPKLLVSFIKQEPQCIMIVDFVRYNTRSTISHGYRFREIFCLFVGRW